ncbi:10427_t:CDS:2, partial [Funneliformis caledonium]
GPPQPSWNLKLYLSIELLRSLFCSYSGTIEELQQSNRNEDIPSHVKIDKVIISHEYRINAQAYIERLVKPYEVAIDPIWKSPRNNGINGELIMNKDWNFNNEEGSWEKEKIVIFLHGGGYCCGNIDSSREILCEISKISGAQRYRDEAIYLSYRASNPEKYRLPAYETDFDNSHFKSQTEVTLEVFDEMFHAFQAFKYCEPAKVSINRTCNFISRVTREAILANPLPLRFSVLRISYDGEVRPLNESSINHILRWDQVGVYPGV